MSRGVQLVWFKRDLRVHDHEPLVRACASGEPVVCLYVFEPELWRLPEHSGRQFAFLQESLLSLDEALRGLGTRLCVRTGTVESVLSALHVSHGLNAIHTHEETGLQWTFDRDIRVRQWARRAGVPVFEARQHGVFRAQASRDGWARRWEALMRAPRLAAPVSIRDAGLGGGEWPDAGAFGLDADPCPGRQTGGRAPGVALLRSFVGGRGQDYRRAMSSPLSAQESCSRLSPHLAFGTVSMREAAQAAWTGRDKARAAGNEALAASLASFLSRLHWHCHFIQKLEDDTTLERRSLHPAYDGLRPDPAADDPVFGAWQTGRTGFPFLDACMRSLQATGWLNFRMRALLMSFVSYQLWFNWRRPGVHLARLFTDFEPGIHYPQVQMQSASTGVNTARIYNPLKQSHDQDPEGVFIRTWVPELAGLPTAALHAPWERGVDVEALGYVARIVDHEQAGRMARERIWSPRKGTAYRAVADAIQARHGSRRSGLPPTGPRQPQLDLITPLTRSGRTSPRKDAPNAP